MCQVAFNERICSSAVKNVLVDVDLAPRLPRKLFREEIIVASLEDR
jgi:hypothetical protein